MQTIIGAIKIKDGLFIGDQYAAQDLEFVVGNKVTHIINCSGKQVPNHWEPIGVKYLTFNWLDLDSQIILDASDKNFSKFYSFIESASIDLTSVLVHCVNGSSRALLVIASYLMKKYSWGLYKTMQFLTTRKNDIELKPGHINQLSTFELRLVRQGLINRNTQWNEPCTDPEEEILKNTFINSQIRDNESGLNEEVKKNDKGKGIKWNEEKMESSTKAKQGEASDNFITIRSCLKGTDKSEIRVPRVVRPSVPKRCSSLNLAKPLHSKEDFKTIFAPKHHPEKSNPLFVEIMQATDQNFQNKVKKSIKKRPVTAPDKKGKKSKVQGSTRSIKKN